MNAIRTVVALGLALVSCAPSPFTQPGGVPLTPGPQPADQQILIVGYPSLPASLDPHLSGAGTFRRFEMFETLVLLSDDAREAKPLIASSWKLVDQRTWRLTLRPDAAFHDGSPLLSDDVVYSWNRVTDTARLKSPVAGALAGVSDIAAIDRNTVEITTRAPDPLLLKKLSYLAIVPKAYVERVGDLAFAAKPIGSGPFRFKASKAEDSLTIVGWPEHRYRRPRLTEVIIRAVPDSQARITGLRTGDLHLVHQLPFDLANTLRSETTEVIFREGTTNGLLLDAWGSDGTDAGPIGSSRVRLAICSAIDRQTLVRNVYGGSVPAVGLLVREPAVGFNPDIKPFVFEPTRARQLLAQAGYQNGFRVGLDYWESGLDVKAIVLLLQQQLRAVGIEVELNPVDGAGWNDRVSKRTASAAMLHTSLSAPALGDAESMLRWFAADVGSGKRYGNPEFDGLFVQAAKEMEPAKRERLLQQAVKVLHDDPPFCPLAPTVSVSAHLKTVGGITLRPADGDWLLFERLYRTK